VSLDLELLVQGDQRAATALPGRLLTGVIHERLPDRPGGDAAVARRSRGQRPRARCTTPAPSRTCEDRPVSPGWLAERP
jgi:hypothetical protein